MSQGTMQVIRKSFRRVKQAGGKVSRRIGLDFSEEKFRALRKQRQELEMAKRGEHVQPKEAMEFVFCLVNERELFNAIS